MIREHGIPAVLNRGASTSAGAAPPTGRSTASRTLLEIYHHTGWLDRTDWLAACPLFPRRDERLADA